MTDKFWHIHFTPVPPAAEAEFRYQAGPGVPDWLVGKTATEAADLTARLYEQLVRGAPAPPRRKDLLK